MASLLPVQQKIFRAAEHIKNLETELEGYFKSGPGKLVREPNTPADQAVFTWQSKSPVPARLALIVGDCLQNLRSALDYLVWELVLAAKNKPGKHNMFPICGSSDVFKEAVSKSKRLLGVDAAAIAVLETLQPYHLGADLKKHTLWAIDELVNINKHRRILIVDLVAAEGPQAGTLIKHGGEEYLYVPAGTNFPIFDRNTKFGPYPIIDGKVHVNTEFVSVVAFGEGAAKGLEVSLCLNEWAVYIKDRLLPLFEKFFA